MADRLDRDCRSQPDRAFQSRRLRKLLSTAVFALLSGVAIVSLGLFAARPATFIRYSYAVNMSMVLICALRAVIGYLDFTYPGPSLTYLHQDSDLMQLGRLSEELSISRVLERVPIMQSICVKLGKASNSEIAAVTESQWSNLLRVLHIGYALPSDHNADRQTNEYTSRILSSIRDERPLKALRILRQLQRHFVKLAPDSALRREVDVCVCILENDAARLTRADGLVRAASCPDDPTTMLRASGQSSRSEEAGAQLSPGQYRIAEEDFNVGRDPKPNGN